MPNRRAEIFLDAFKTGFAIGERGKEQKKEDALSKAYNILGDVGGEVEYDDALNQQGQPVSAIPEHPTTTPGQRQVTQSNREMAQLQYDRPVTTARQQLAEQAGGMDQRQKVSLADMTMARMEARRALKNARVGGKDILEFDKEWNQKMKGNATKYRDMAVNAWQTGNLPAAEKYIESAYQYINDGADVHAKFIDGPDGNPALALSFTDSLSGSATVDKPMLVESPEKFLSLAGRAIDFTDQLELDKTIQAMDLAESAEERAQTKHKQDNWMFNKTKDLVVKGKEMDLLEKYTRMRQGEATLALGWAKAAASASSNGWGSGSGSSKSSGSSLLSAEKELSKQVDSLITNTDRIPREKIQQRKATGAAFLLANGPGVPVAEVANVALNYSELQDRAMSQAQANVAERPGFENIDTPEYRSAVKAEMKKLMAPHHDVIDGDTYYISEGNYYRVPPRFVSGNRQMTTFTDIMTQLQAQVTADPALKRAAELAGVEEGGGVQGATAVTTARGATTDSKTTPPPAPKDGTTPPRPTAQTAPPNIDATGLVRRAQAQRGSQAVTPPPGQQAKQDAIPQGPRVESRTVQPRQTSLDKGMLPERPGGYGEFSPKEVKELNNSLRKVRLYAVGGAGGAEKPTVQDLTNALSHPNIDTGEKAAIQRIIDAITRNTRRGARSGPVPAKVPRRAIEVR